MLFLKKFFNTGHPAAVAEVDDRAGIGVARALTPEKIDAIMRDAESGDIERQSRLAREVLMRNWDIMQAVNTRKLAVLGCSWSIQPGDKTPEAARASRQLEDMLRSCGDGDDALNFEEMLEDLLGALLPGFAVVEILWLPGGGFAGFNSIGQEHFTFAHGFTPRLVTRDAPLGIELIRERFIFHRLRIHGGDPALGGLIRPLAWLHCFANLNFKDLLGFIEKYGMPFIAAKVDPATADREKSAVKRLIRNFGSSGGGIFSRAVELQLLSSTDKGEVYFELLKYVQQAIDRLVLGQLASGGESSGLSGGDAQSRVRQDILEADCRLVSRTIDTQLCKVWSRYNVGPAVPPPRFVLDCAAPEDKAALAQTVKTLYDAGLEVDAEELSDRLGMKLTRRPAPSPAAPAPPFAMSDPPSPRLRRASPTDEPENRNLAAALEEYLGPLADGLAALGDDKLSDAEAMAKAVALCDAPPGDAAKLAGLIEKDMLAGYAEGKKRHGQRS